jgi:hypothetical protein
MYVSMCKGANKALTSVSYIYVCNVAFLPSYKI